MQGRNFFSLGIVLFYGCSASHLDQSVLMQRQAHMHENLGNNIDVRLNKTTDTDMTYAQASLKKAVKYTAALFLKKQTTWVADTAIEPLSEITASSVARILSIMEPNSETLNKVMLSVARSKTLGESFFVLAIEAVKLLAKKSKTGNFNFMSDAAGQVVVGLAKDIRTNLLDRFAPGKTSKELVGRLMLHLATVGAKQMNLEPPVMCILSHADLAVKTGGMSTTVKSVRSLARASKDCLSGETASNFPREFLNHMNASLNDDMSLRDLPELLETVFRRMPNEMLPPYTANIVSELTQLLVDKHNRTGKHILRFVASYLDRNGGSLRMHPLLKDVTIRMNRNADAMENDILDPFHIGLAAIQASRHHIDAISSWTGLSSAMTGSLLMSVDPESAPKEVRKLAMQGAGDLMMHIGSLTGSHVVTIVASHLRALLMKLGPEVNPQERSAITRQMTEKILDYAFRNSTLNMKLPGSLVDAVSVLVRQAANTASAVVFGHETDDNIMNSEIPASWTDDLIKMLHGNAAMRGIVTKCVDILHGRTDMENRSNIDTIFKLGEQVLSEAGVPGVNLISRAVRQVINHLETGHQEQDNHKFMREMWSIGQDALHGVDLAENEHGVVGHLRDIWFSPANSKTLNLVRGGGHDFKNMELAGEVQDFKDYFTIFTNLGIFAMRGMMLFFGLPFDFMIVVFNSLTKVVLMLPISALKFARMDYHIPRSMSFQFGSNFFYPATEHFAISRAIGHTLNDHLNSLTFTTFFFNHNTQYLLTQKVPCLAGFGITVTQLGLSLLGIKNLWGFKEDWVEVDFENTNAVLKVSFQFLLIAKLLETFANAEISRRSCSETDWADETVEKGPERMDWKKETLPEKWLVNTETSFQVVKGSLETVKLYSYTRLLSGLSFIVYGSCAIIGLEHDGRMPSAGAMTDAVPLMAFTVFSTVLAPDLFKPDKTDYGFYDTGLGPMSMRWAQMVDNLASFFEPMFYVLYSGNENYEKWRRSTDPTIPEGLISYKSANVAAQAMNLLSGIATTTVNTIALSHLQNPCQEVNQDQCWQKYSKMLYPQDTQPDKVSASLKKIQEYKKKNMKNQVDEKVENELNGQVNDAIFKFIELDPLFKEYVKKEGSSLDMRCLASPEDTPSFCKDKKLKSAWKYLSFGDCDCEKGTFDDLPRSVFTWNFKLANQEN